MANIRVVPLWACQRGLKKIKKKKKKKRGKNQKKINFTNLSDGYVCAVFVLHKGKAGLLKITYNFTPSLHFKGALVSKDLLIIHCCHSAYCSSKRWAQAVSLPASDSHDVSLASERHSLVLLSFLPRLQGSC